MKKWTLLIILLFVGQLVNAQYQIGLIPRSSPDKAIFQKIGYTEVRITYGSPAVKNRHVWGELVPYDKVWRAGANNATTVEFSSPVNINGMLLDSGKYAFFVLPQENQKWMLIFNQIHKQWGAFSYDEEEDAMRVEVLPRRTAFYKENLTYSIRQTGFQYGSILLNWEYMEIELPFETDYLLAFQKEVDARAQKQPEHIRWIVYLQGAEHLEEIHSNSELAKEWIDTAEEIMDATTEWNKQFYPRAYVHGHLYWTKAKLLAWMNNYSDAIDYVEKLKAMEAPIFYEKEKEEEGIDRFLDFWSTKN